MKGELDPGAVVDGRYRVCSTLGVGGMYHQQMNHLARARAEYQQALQIDPDHEEATRALAGLK